MIKHIFIIVFLLFYVLTASAESPEDARFLKILNNPKIINYPGIKILKMTFTKFKSTEFQESWKSYVKIKSCYTIKMDCQVNGIFYSPTEDGLYVMHSSSSLLWNKIDKNDIADNSNFKTDDGMGTIYIHKSDYDTTSSFEVSVICDPIYSEHPNIYPPSDKYWKKFLPKNNECLN